ncbi:MAG: SpoIIE family protein phosphatase [Firmicutes bacterium]|nr:SpoIIE family protein phosphatase [Bacillota bacterium]
MDVRGSIGKVKTALRGGAAVMQRPAVQRVASCALNFALGLLMASARVLGACGPFGIGIVSRSGPGLAGVFCVLGAAAGYLLSGGLDWGARYVAACALIFTVAFVFQGTQTVKKSWFMPSVAATVMLVTGFLNSFEFLSPTAGLARMLTDAVLAGGSAYFFAAALSDKAPETEAEEVAHGVSLLLLLACAMMTVSEWSILGVVSLGRLLALLMVMSAAYRGGLLTGAASGVAFGLSMDVASGGAPFYAMAYAFAGLLTGVFSRKGRVLFTLSFILANAAAVTLGAAEGLRTSALYETFVASVVFLLLPAPLVNYLGALLQPGGYSGGESALRRYMARRIQNLGEAFNDLFDTVHKTIGSDANDNDVARVFDRAADQVCSSCKRKNECWNLEYVDTLGAMNDATKAMMERGSLRREDLPEPFTDRCRHPYQFISAVNGELRGMLYRRQYKSRMSENRVAAYGQYRDMGELLADVSRDLAGSPGPDPLAERRLARFLNSADVEGGTAVFRDGGGRLRAVIEGGRLSALQRDPAYLDKISAVLGVRLCRQAADNLSPERRLTLLEAEPLSVSVGIAAMKKQGEPVSGDRGTYFKTDRGQLCVILSDGMGSGDDAAKESESVVRILEKFLRAGLEPAVTMKLLNSVMLLKNNEEWGYATVDLMVVDLFTGDTCFYKYGAAPSYVRYGKLIRRVRCDSMAAGMAVGEGSAPEVLRMKLRPGSLALIASDGVVLDENDLWLRDLLLNFEGSDTKALAKEALQQAAKQYGCEDDMTVLAVYVDERN